MFLFKKFEFYKMKFIQGAMSTDRRTIRPPRAGTAGSAWPSPSGRPDVSAVRSAGQCADSGATDGLGRVALLVEPRSERSDATRNPPSFSSENFPSSDDFCASKFLVQIL